MESENQLRLGEVIGVLKGNTDALKAHTEADAQNFAEVHAELKDIKIQMSGLEKLAWMSIGGVGVMGLQGITQLISNFLMR